MDLWPLSLLWHAAFESMQGTGLRVVLFSSDFAYVHKDLDG